MSKTPLLAIKSISKHYGSGDTLVRAVDKISLNINKGDIILIKGPSGSGKTTLLTLIGLLLKQSKGSMYYQGTDIFTYSQNQKADFRLHNIGFIFQSFNLLPSLSARENIAIAGTLSKLTEVDRKVYDLLDKLGLKGRANHRPEQLSGGERQRVAIARALINEPEIILADEPTANLDSRTGLEVIDMLCQFACEQHKAVVIVSHDERIERSVKQIMTIEDGKFGSTTEGGHNLVCIHHKKIRGK